MILVKVFVILFVSGCASGHFGDINLDSYSTPAYIIVGTRNGYIWRCNFDAPTKCELFYTGVHEVIDTLVHGEHLYTSNVNGEIQKCHWYEKKCALFHKTNRWMLSLAATSGFLYALDGRHIWRCKLNLPHSCTVARTFESVVLGLYEHDKFMYVSGNYTIFRCSKDMDMKCQEIGKTHEKQAVVAGWGNNIILVNYQGNVSTYNTTSNKTLNGVNILRSCYDMTVFKGNLYVLDYSDLIVACKWGSNKCTDFAKNKGATSISFFYATHTMSGYLNDENACGGQFGASLYNYEEEHRALLEVSVVDGKLHDARGAPVNTRNADKGCSGKAAVFAMGLGGQLLLSYAHRSGLVHIISFFAGHPVSGAGEMVVEDGVIKRIVACSEYYRADVALNRQVVEALYSRGYTREMKLEECAYTCDNEV